MSFAPDFPGYGESSAPSVNDFDYSYERLATVTEKFTEKLNLSSSAGNFLRQGQYTWAEVMGVTYDRVAFDLSFGVADHDIELDAMIVGKGTVARTTRRLTGYVGDVPLMAVELKCMIDKSALPQAFEMAVGSHGWLASIDCDGVEGALLSMSASYDDCSITLRPAPAS
jgi:hypothetical protein